MSIKLLAKVWTLKVSGTEREVLNAMCDHADDFGREARPSIAYIAWKVGCDERTVIRHIKKLREKKALLLERPARDHSPNVYRVDLSVYENKADFVPKGDGYHATRTSERGDILSERGDKLVSPKPSFKPNNNKPPIPDASNIADFEKAWDEVRNMLVVVSPIVIAEFRECWQSHPDPRRAAYALKQTKEYANPVSWKYYKTVYERYDPDKVKPSPAARHAAQRSGVPSSTGFKIEVFADGSFYG
jgi:hypothetical protein